MLLTISGCAGVASHVYSTCLMINEFLMLCRLEIKKVCFQFQVVEV